MWRVHRKKILKSKNAFSFHFSVSSWATPRWLRQNSTSSDGGIRPRSSSTPCRTSVARAVPGASTEMGFSGTMKDKSNGSPIYKIHLFTIVFGFTQMGKERKSSQMSESSGVALRIISHCGKNAHRAILATWKAIWRCGRGFGSGPTRGGGMSKKAEVILTKMTCVCFTLRFHLYRSWYKNEAARS